MSNTTSIGTTPGASVMSLANQLGGSGQNGPATAQHGLSLNCIKSQYFSGTVVGSNYTPHANTGEIDCISIVQRQDGQNSDGSGILVDVSNTGLGFASATEFTTSSVNVPTNSYTHKVGAQEAVVSGGNNAYGIVVFDTVGKGSVAYMARAITDGNNLTATWTDLFQGINQAGTNYFDISGDGSAVPGSITTSGNIAASRITAASVQAAGSVISTTNGAYNFAASDCGTVVRDNSSSAHTMTVPAGLPVGCRIGVIQIGTGAPTITAGSGMSVEAFQNSATSAGQFAQLTVLIDTVATASIGSGL